MAESSQRRHAIVNETTVGVTPATPVWKEIRLTGGGMSERSQYVTSNQIRADRNVADSILVSRDVDGEFQFELSYGSFDDLLEYFMCSGWDDDVLVNGVEHKTFSYECTDKFESGLDFERFTGCMANNFNLNIQARDKITGSFTIMGEQMTVGTAILTGATYTPPSETPIFTASNDVGSLLIDGASAGSVLSIQLNGVNNINVRPVVGNLHTKGLLKGQFIFSGTLNVYFTSADLRDLQRANGFTDIALTIGTGADNKYDILIPKVRLTGYEKSKPGNNEDIMLEVGFTAIYDADTDGAVAFTRYPEA